jgi:hypothetical protein
VGVSKVNAIKEVMKERDCGAIFGDEVVALFELSNEIVIVDFGFEVVIGSYFVFAEKIESERDIVAQEKTSK